jgi:hypothetical protein
MHRDCCSLTIPIRNASSAHARSLDTSGMDSDTPLFSSASLFTGNWPLTNCTSICCVTDTNPQCAPGCRSSACDAGGEHNT